MSKSAILGLPLTIVWSLPSSALSCNSGDVLSHCRSWYQRVPVRPSTLVTHYTNPASTADEFACQLADLVKSELDAVAPVGTLYRRPSKKSTWWLSSEAIAAKRHRRKLERTWRSSGLDRDRVACRKCCRQTNAIITASCRNYIQSQLEDLSDSKQRWRVVRNLLHTDTKTCMSMSDCATAKLCTCFAGFLSNKINTLKQNIAHKLSSLPPLLLALSMLATSSMPSGLWLWMKQLKFYLPYQLSPFH